MEFLLSHGNPGKGGEEGSRTLRKPHSTGVREKKEKALVASIERGRLQLYRAKAGVKRGELKKRCALLVRHRASAREWYLKKSELGIERGEEKSV